MKAYLTISHGDISLGTLRLSLRPDIVPKTVDNFVHFLTANSTGSDDATAANGYRNSTFHRIIPNFMAQGGDFTNHDGTGCTSLYGPSFNDENFILSHSQRGTLSMANSGPNTNGCQFFISFKATGHLDGKHVVFGYVDWREDDESARVLEMLERVQTNKRRGDRPLEVVKIVDCGLVDEGRGSGKSSGKVGEEKKEGDKLMGEAKKNKLMQAYGEVNPNAAADEDEIDLDAEEDEGGGEEAGDVKEANSSNKHGDGDEIDLEDDENDETTNDVSQQQPSSEPDITTGKVSSKKLALQKRLAALKKKINQSRNLNRREVHAEATRLGTDEASIKERKRLSKEDRNLKQKEYDTYVVGKLRNVAEEDIKEDKKLASLSQPAFESIRQMNSRANKKERAQHGPDDYYNPEGQYSNYERNLKSIRHGKGSAAAPSAALDTYDPTMATYNANPNEREGAKRLANEMKHRAEKRNNAKRKPEFDAYDVSYINDRNKRFNEKISRNFDESTAEIRQNLERGTAL